MAQAPPKAGRTPRPVYKIVATTEAEEQAYDYVSARVNVKKTRSGVGPECRACSGAGRAAFSPWLMTLRPLLRTPPCRYLPYPMRYIATFVRNDYLRRMYLTRHTAKKSVTGSVAHIVKGALGGGILGGHVAYMKAGVWVALPLNILFGLYMTYCLHLLVESAQLLYRRTHIPSMSYPDVGEAACALHPNPKVAKFSKPFRYIIDFVICLDLFGACACYQLIIAKSIKQLVENVQQSDNPGIAAGYPHLRVYLAAMIIPCVAICLITHLKWLAPFSIGANLVILVAMFTAVYFATQMNPKFVGMRAASDFHDFLEYSGMIVFSMSCAGVVIPVENNMKEPNKFNRALVIGMGLVILGTVMVSFFGYAGYLETCASPITVNFPMTTFPKILKGLIAVMIYITHAVNFWPPFNICFYYIQRRHPEEKVYMWELIYRAIFVIAIALIAIIFPDINSLMGFLGSVCLSNMAFIWPSIIDILVIYDRPGFGKYKWKLWRSIICLIIGIFLLVCGGIVNAKGMVHTFLNANFN